jgi:HprK-related kinase A
LKIAEYSNDALCKQLKQTGLILQTGPFKSHIRSSVPSLASNIALIYRDFSTLPQADFSDFHINISLPRNLRRYVRRQAFFYFDGKTPFMPLAHQQAFPMFEWGLNWCISSHSHQYLIIHAAVVAKDDRALIMPAPPGSGKSTLCAALVNRGWRLLSDELALVDVQDGRLVPLSRPINLKNDSIDIIKEFEPTAVFTEKFHDTSKGTVALMRPPQTSVENIHQTAKAAWVICPKYMAGSNTELEQQSTAQMYMQVAGNCFNYSILGLMGYNALVKMMNSCHCYNMTYSNLNEAIDTVNSLEIPATHQDR